MSGKAILFYGYNGDYPEFSNFYPSTIRIGGKEYRTVEHYFQACKTTDKRSHEKIRQASTPKQAKLLGRKVQLRSDWESVKQDVMYRGLLAKFSQHENLKALLLGTGDSTIHETSPTDAVWGWMGGSGKDLLGKLLMRVRETIRKL